MDATLTMLAGAGAQLDIEEVEMGEALYRQGLSAGISADAFDSLRRSEVLLKGPITTPQGGGYKSLNVTLRKTFGLFANVRACLSYAPYVRTAHRDMDVVIIRENEEDLYAGIEHRQTADVVQCLKLITRPGCERVVRYAFEFARVHGRKKVTCMTKDNIMKATDGLFHRVFDEVAAEYSSIASEHMIIDIGTARLATGPEAFDVIVVPNLYGDILSDVAAEVSGSVGLGGSMNVGDGFALFEAIHGSAPLIAGQDQANPSGLLLAAVEMLAYVDQPDVANVLHNAWLRTIEDGVHTPDVATSGQTTRMVGTRAFTQAVIDRLGLEPVTLGAARHQRPTEPISVRVSPRVPVDKHLVGVDVFVEWHATPDELAAALGLHASEHLGLTMISNRGQKVWPDGAPETLCVDHWRCRFEATDSVCGIAHTDIVSLLGRLADAGFDFLKTEGLYTFDGTAGYSLSQGQ